MLPWLQPAPRLGGFFLLATALTIYLLVSNRSGWGTGLPWHDEQRLAQLWLFAGALALAARCAPTKALRLGCLGVGLVLLCVGVAPYPGWALAEVAVLSGMAATAWAVAGLRRAQPKWFDLAAATVMVLLCLSYLWGFGLVFTLQLGYHQGFDIRELFSGYANRRFFSQTQALTLPMLMLPLIAPDVPRSVRGLVLTVAAAWWSLAMLVGTRTVWLVMVGVALWSWCCWGNMGRQWVRQQGIAALAGALLFWGLFIALPHALDERILSDNSRLADLALATDSSGRLDLWWASLGMIVDHPLLGVGPMHFAAASGLTAAHPHNLLLQLAAEWGLPLACLSVSMLILGLRRLFPRRIQESEDGAVRVCLSATLLSALGVSLFDGLAVMPYSQVLLAGLIGWGWGVATPTTSSDLPSSARGDWRWRALWGVSAILLALYLAWLALQAEPQILRHNEAYPLNAPGQPFKPRFWQQGIIGLPWDERYPAPWFKSATRPEAPAKPANPG